VVHFGCKTSALNFTMGQPCVRAQYLPSRGEARRMLTNRQAASATGRTKCCLVQRKGPSLVSFEVPESGGIVSAKHSFSH
jgi:hypothetical protein